MIIAQGAEAVIRKEGDKIIKERPVKGYRVAELDRKLRKSRTRREAKVLEKLAGLAIPAPHLFAVNDKDMIIEMEFIDGDKLRDVLESGVVGFSLQMGKLIGKLHSHDIIHADLTTSNMIVRDGSVVLIDFGLSFFSKKEEDKAVDLNLLHRALESKHFKVFEQCWEKVLESYCKTYADSDIVIERLKKVQMRGRNKGK